MKNRLALMLSALLLVSLAACGGGTMAKEEMLETAAECNFSAIQSAYNDNSVNAEETYCGQVYRFTGYVEQIDEESVKIIPLNSPPGFAGLAYDVAVEATLSRKISGNYRPLKS